MAEGTQHSERLADLGADNRARCFMELRRRGDQTIAELASVTGFSRPTLKGHLESLVASGLVVEGERGTSSRGGRPAVTFSVNPRGAYLAVFDVSRHEHRYLLCDISGAVWAALVEEVDEGLDPARRADLIEAGLRGLAASAGVDWSAVRGLSGSVGAQVDSGGSVVRDRLEHGLLDHDFARRFDIGLTLENDLKAACYAEQRIGCAQGIGDVVYALAWYQVAAGVVLDGKIRRGAHELAGELNRVASTAEIPAQRAEDWKSWPAFLEVVRAAERGDESAAASVDDFCGRAAHQIAMLAMSLDPEMIVLGGPLVHRSEHFVTTFETSLAEALRAGPPIRVAVSALHSWAPALGATLRGLEAIERELVGGPSLDVHLRNASDMTLPLVPASEARTAHAS